MNLSGKFEILAHAYEPIKTDEELDFYFTINLEQKRRFHSAHTRLINSLVIFFIIMHYSDQ